MTHSSDDKNYVRAVLSYLGIDFDEAVTCSPLISTPRC